LGVFDIINFGVNLFWARPFFLCLAMILWFVTREQMTFQVMLLMH